METTNFFPAIEIRKTSSGAVLASTAITIHSMLSPRLRQGNELDPGREIIDNHEAHLAFLRAISGWPESVIISLNLFTRPDVLYHPGGKLQTAIVITVRGRSGEKVTAEILSRHSALGALLNNFFPEAEFVSVQDETSLQRILVPFTPSVVKAITRRRQSLRVSIHQPRSCGTGVQDRPIGFLAPLPGCRKTAEKDEHVIPYLFPWIGAGRHDLSAMAEAMLLTPSPLWFQARLRPQRARRATLSRLTGTLRECEELASHDHHDDSHLSLQIKALSEAVTERLQQLSVPVLSGAAFLSSTTEIDEAITKAVATVISPGPAPVKEGKISLFGGTTVKSTIPNKYLDPFFLPDREPCTPEEAACMFRIPFPENPDVPGLPLKKYRTIAAEPDILGRPTEGCTILGDNIHRGYSNPVRQSLEEKMRHTCILGQTGTGKSTLLSSMVLQDIEAGHGLCLIDPHGDLVEDVLAGYPERRRDDLVLLDFLDPEWVIPLNLLAWEHEDDRDFLIDELYGWLDSEYDMRQTGGPIFELYFRCFLRVLMAVRKDAGFVPVISDFSRMFVDRQFRNFCKQRIEDEDVARMMHQAEEAGSDISLNNIAPYITSKFNRFTMDRNLKRITGQEKMALQFADIMDSGRVMLVNLGRGRLGNTITSLLAGQIVARFKAAAMQRVTMAAAERREFFLYVDEFQNLASSTFTSLLSEARKFRLGLVLANQYADQLDAKTGPGGDSVLRAILGNVGTMIGFRVGVQDAELLEPVFAPAINRQDLANLPLGVCYVSLKSDQGRPVTLSMQTRHTRRRPRKEQVRRLRSHALQRYGIPARQAEKNLEGHNCRIDKLLEE